MAAFHKANVAFFAIVSLLLVLQANAYTMEDMCEQWSGEGYVGNPSDCTKWGYCRQQKLVAYGQCNSGLVYDSETATCQYNTKVACSTSVAQTCSALTTAGYVADPTDCSKYAYCFGNGKYQSQKCPSGQNYAANNNTCIWGPTCTQNTICRFMQNNIYVGDPANCGKYLQCVKGYGVSGSCESNYFYNAATGYCQKANPCSNSGGNNVDPDSVSYPPNPDACDKLPTGLNYAHDSATCYGFYSCKSTATVKGQWGACPFGLEFNGQYCVSPASFACGGNRCQNTNLTYAAKPNTGCTEYTYCPNGSPGQCPPDFPYYDEISFKCVRVKPAYKICQTYSTYNVSGYV